MKIRHILISLAFLAATLCASAQQTVGQFNLYPVFGTDITNIVRGGDKIYFVTSKSLYSYDTKADETIAYTTRNYLNDVSITGIYRNDPGKYLLIAYASGNIDLLYDDGRVVNLGDIASASMTQDKTINDVAFHEGKIYLATAFGVVIFNDTTHTVEQSGIYPNPISGIAVVNNHIVISVLTEQDVSDMLAAPIDARINTLSSFKKAGISLFAFRDMQPLGKDVVGVDKYNQVSYVHLDWSFGSAHYDNKAPVFVTQALIPNADGTISVVGKRNLNQPEVVVVTLADGFQETGAVDVPIPLSNQHLLPVDGLKDVWGVDFDGLAHYSVTDGVVTVLSEKAKPEATTVSRVAFIRGSADGSRIYISNIGVSRVNSAAPKSNSNGTDVMQNTDYLVDGRPHDAAAFEAVMEVYEAQYHQAQAGSSRIFGGCQRIAVDPVKPNRYYIANYIEGVYVIEDNEIIGKFTLKNMPTFTFWGDGDAGAMAFDVNFDPQGNLWVGCWEYLADATKFSPYTVLPKAKLYGDLSAITKDDWQLSKHMGSDIGNMDMGSAFSTKSNYFFTWHSGYGNPLGVTDTKGTYANTADDKFFELIGIRDQDGGEFKPVRWLCGVEDKRGRMWFGTTNGPIEITNPAKVADAAFTFTRLKVPRNDGTNYADYLLENDQINDIAVDGQNRKWLATENSGVYLVSENGDAILEHFTTANSDLPSNTVTAVYCDPNSNVVYFGLTTGLASYNSTAAPAAPDYSDVYAYPNPVKPDYNGWITIKGLMDNSLIKIADAAGNVLLQTRSEGGMVVWDGCNTAGERVRSGVYYVFASQNANGDNSGAVTKILVIN